ncbi:Amino acid transporter family [Giardia duodenalis assemblage B]|uniref:Amino acid transporter family n=2 Tax=Giardia intestinalis TaxID=5741 RepID=A0A132NV62_GIAIN|nr:Amino acid transporter [Giardia intestinalis]KWX13958.1 Amino acid transporter family [Giardia intestinalis assemblage B]
MDAAQGQVDLVSDTYDQQARPDGSGDIVQPGKVVSDAKGLYDATVTLSNTMIGMSILTFPYTVYRLGWVISAFLLAGAFLYSVMGFNAIIDAAYFTQERSLKAIVQIVTNKHTAFATDVVMAIHMIGILVVYTCICGDYFHSSIVGFSYGKLQIDVRYVKAIIAVLLIPFMFLRDASKLSRIGIFSTLFIIITVVSTLVYFIVFMARGVVTYAGTVEDAVVELEHPYQNASASPVTPLGAVITCPTEGCKMRFPNPLLIALPAHKTPWKAFFEIVRRVSIFLALFGCQISIAPLLAELKGNAVKRRKIFRKSLLISALMVLTLQAVMAIAAAFSFGDKLQSNVLLSFPSVEIYMTVIKLLYACVVFIIFILKMFPIRYVILGWFKLTIDVRKGKIAFYLLGILIVIVAVLLSIFVPNIDTVFNAISALFGIVTYWLVPLLLVYKRPYLEATSVLTLLEEPNKKSKRKSHQKYASLDNQEDQQLLEDIDDSKNAERFGEPRRRHRHRQVEETSADQVGVGFLAFFGLPVKQARAFTKVFRTTHSMHERLLTRQDKHIIKQHEIWHNRACSLPASEAGSEEIESAHQMIQEVISFEYLNDGTQGGEPESSASHAVAIYKIKKTQEDQQSRLSDGNKHPAKALKTIMTMRKRRNSVSESNPAQDYCLLQDAVPQGRAPKPPRANVVIGEQEVGGQGDDAHTLHDDLLVAGGQETIQNINKEEERRQGLKRRMTKTRLAIAICATVIIGAVNLTGFVLSTFMDIETFTWIF